MSIAISVLFILLGIAIKYGKMYNLIAGYNTMSEADKEKYDIEGIAKVFKNVMFGMSFLLIVGYIISRWLNQPKTEIFIAIPIIVLGLIYLIVVSNSSKYKVKD